MSADRLDPSVVSSAEPVVLVIDDEPQIRHTLAEALTALPARVIEASGAREGLEQARAARPDLLVLDLGLPDGSGLEVCQAVRQWSLAPIIVLSARHAEAEKVELLNAGADDYVSKPFGLGEVVARVQAQLRRARAPRHDPGKTLEVDGLSIDLVNRAARRAGAAIHLTPTEWLILQSLVRHAGRPVTHQQIFDEVWGRDFGNPSQYLRVYVTHLRRKIERNPATPRIIVTEPGVGYRFGHAQD